MLTDTKVKQAKAESSPYKLADSQGLYLYVSSKGAKSWRYDYRYAGKRYTVTLGRYPDLPIAKARKRHEEARTALELGQNPTLVKRQQRQAKLAAAGDTFVALAESWYEGKQASRSEAWRSNARRWLDKELYPIIGNRAMREIRPADILEIMKGMAKAGKARSATYVRQLISQIFDFAIANLRADFNPAHSLRGAIQVPEPKQRPPLTPKEIPEFLRAVDSDTGRVQTKYAAKLLLLTFTRKVELTAAKWQEIDFDNALWRIPASRMKSAQDHIVPLSKQALAYFHELKRLSSDSEFVFPHYSRLDRPISRTTLNIMFDRIGYGDRFTPHGVRNTASTILNEQGYRADVIERQLSHVERDNVRAAYNKAEYLEDRRAMMQQWADMLDAWARGDKVVSLHAGRAA